MTPGDGQPDGRPAHGAPATSRTIRALNDHAALTLLAAEGQQSRSEIARRTGISKPTASQVLSRLEAAQLVEATGQEHGRRGRSPVMYRINPAAGHGAGLDVTAARVSAAIVDLSGSVVARHELPTGRRTKGAVLSVMDALTSAASSIGLTVADLDAVVIGTPGSFDPATGRLSYAKHLTGWHSPGLLGELSEAVGSPVHVENDVNLAALAERHTGVAVDCSDFFLFWVGDGLGGALMVDDRLYRGATGGAGEVGFMQGTGAALVRRVRRENSGGFQAYAGPEQTVPLARTYGLRGRTASDVVARAAGLVTQDGSRSTTESDTERASAFLTDLSVRYAAGLASIIAIVDPAMVVLGGSVMQAGGEPLRSRVAAQLAELAMARPTVVVSTVADNPVLTGALGAALERAREAVFAAG
ncbi:ROK family transcriptional regulator [Monashia sp. NPDC004114]